MIAKTVEAARMKGGGEEGRGVVTMVGAGRTQFGGEGTGRRMQNILAVSRGSSLIPVFLYLSIYPSEGWAWTKPMIGSCPHSSYLRRRVSLLAEALRDRQLKLNGVLKKFGITPSRSHKVLLLLGATVEDLQAIPNTLLTALTPGQLIQFAQVVYTALFKSYLLTMPGLLGPLCPIENWCEGKPF